MKQIRLLADVPPMIARYVLPHFQHYEAIFILRAYRPAQTPGRVRYDLHNIPVDLLARVGNLTEHDFSPRTKVGTTSASVRVDGKTVFRFLFDGSDDKLTIKGLDIRCCPLHAWWSLEELVAPDDPD